MEMGAKVKVVSINAFTGMVGKIKTGMKEGRRTEYCVQFYKPYRWCWFEKRS